MIEIKILCIFNYRVDMGTKSFSKNSKFYFISFVRVVYKEMSQIHFKFFLSYLTIMNCKFFPWCFKLPNPFSAIQKSI